MITLLASLFAILWGSSSLILVTTCALFAYFYSSVKKKHSYWKERGIGHEEPKFLLGNISIFRSKSFAEIFQDGYNKHLNDRYYGFYQFLKPAIVIKDPKLIKLITVKEFDHFVNHPLAADAHTDPLWSRNLIASRDDRWRDLRSTLSPSFTSSKMKIMFKIMDECAQQFVEFFGKEKSEVVELEMKDTFSRYTNDVIATTAFGLKCDSLKDRANEFFAMGKEATDFGGLRLLRFFMYTISPTLARLLKVRVIPANVAEYFSKIIENTIKVRENSHIVRPDMIHLLMEAQKGRHQQEEDLKVNEGFSTVSESEVHKNRNKDTITLQDITSQAFIFFLAGFDTASTLLSFLFYELAVNREVQDRLRKEVQTVSDNMTYEILLQLKYLDMVVSETLRKWPAIFTDREVSDDFIIPPERPEERAVHLEKGVICMLPIFPIHRDANNYHEPDKFDPERFSDENRHKIDPSLYLPFGAGPRSCIGSRFALLEVKLIVYRVLMNFEVVTIAKTPIPMVLDSYQVNPAAKGGMWLGLKKIQ